MKFQDYLQKTKETATVEKEILDQLSEILSHGKELDLIQVRAAKSALQVLIENAIGKGKRILKYYQCPMVFHKGKEVFWVLAETGVIDEEFQTTINQAIGFRNSMFHDYMNFDEETLVKILKENQYSRIYEFLIAPMDLNETMIKRINTFSY
ncbi:DUF86 domain-containing protein [bacterium]|nr:DUF86 domain-containing protein [bacterium]